MGIQVEFTPDLALRNIEEFKKGNRKEGECIPTDLTVGEVYNFLKKGQRLFWLSDDEEWSRGELPLCETKGGGKFSSPCASVKILEATHFLEKGDIWTKGKYKVIEVFKDDRVRFNCFKKIK
ncbi:MAG: hypothetical protein WCI72_01955 [archaeon]